MTTDSLIQRGLRRLRDVWYWQLLRRLHSRDPFWTPPGGSWRIRRLASTYRIKRERAIRAVIAEFMAELDELVREARDARRRATYRAMLTDARFARAVHDELAGNPRAQDAWLDAVAAARDLRDRERSRLN